jgi:hypothetical protein
MIAMSVPHWGSIANPELDRRRVKAVYFFAGDWKSNYNPIQFYEHPSAGPNDHFYTVHPADGRHLGWSVRVENRAFAVDEMMRAGANVVTMSYWGERGTDHWRYWAPMQTSTFAHDQLFDVTLGRPLLILPAIEGGGATPGSPAFEFSNDFPPDDVARSPLVAQIKDLITRYLQALQNPLWGTRWLQMYDQSGVRRHAIHIIQVKSNKIGPDEHARFANGFDAVANHVESETGVPVGFTIDALL